MIDPPVTTPALAAPPLVRRAVDLRTLTSETWDVVIVGGGIVGSGALLDAVSRGMRAALVEQDDIAAGTSSRSSRLIHGGLRYLEQFRFGLVREALAERSHLLTLAPHRPATIFVEHAQAAQIARSIRLLLVPGCAVVFGVPNDAAVAHSPGMGRFGPGNTAQRHLLHRAARGRQVLALPSLPGDVAGHCPVVSHRQGARAQ